MANMRSVLVFPNTTTKLTVAKFVVGAGRQQSTKAATAASDLEHYGWRAAREVTKQTSGLERLPMKHLLRNVILGTFFSSPLLLRPGLFVMRKIAESTSSFASPDRNPILRAMIKPLIYNHFCAGVNQIEICRTRDAIKRIGFSGIILCYGKEVVVDRSNKAHSTGTIGQTAAEIAQWRDGNLETLEMVGEGDWLGMKLSGAGTGITNMLMKNKDAPPEFVDAMDAICESAKAKNCRIWVDSEQQALQTAIDRWTIDMMRKWNRSQNALVYNTLQGYLKASRDKLQYQLKLADEEGWKLAIKLVRGAYIDNDQRYKIHDTKQDTDNSYNGIVHDLLSGTNLGFHPDKFPKMQLFLAGHNPESVSKAWNLVQALSQQGALKVVPDFGQLQGMADNLSCDILQQREGLLIQAKETNRQVTTPHLYKCLTWGSVQECMQYLLRRVVENSGGADRMRDGLSAYAGELRRRVLRF